MIEGVGPKIEKMLNDDMIFTYADLVLDLLTVIQ